MNQSKVIGLTGGSGSGKTTVASIFKEQGAYIIDADKVSHNLTDSDHTVLNKIKEEFSEKVFEEGVLSRKALGKIVFEDKTKLEKLNKILHPKIAEKISDMVNKSGSDIVVIDAPLLFDVNDILSLCDTTVAVCASDEKRIKRIMSRDGLNYDEAIARIDSQIPQDDLARLADFVITNDDDIEKLRSVVVDYLGK